MKILVIGKFYTEGFALHIAETLATMGHEVVRYAPGYKPIKGNGKVLHRFNQVFSTLYTLLDAIPFFRAWHNAALWPCVRDQKIDLIIACYDFLQPAELDAIKKHSNARIVMWYPDSMANFGRAYFMNTAYDALFFKDPYIVKTMKDVLPSPVYFLPECFNPDQHWVPDHDLGDLRMYQCEIATAGNQHSWRVALFRHLASFDVKIWGAPAPLWLSFPEIQAMYQGRGVYNHEKVRAFRGAKIVLNNLHYSEVQSLNCRAFEAAGAGAFQMVDARPGMELLFEPGKELVVYDGVSDLLEKIAYWLPREEERNTIATAGMQRAHREHTYQHRLELLVATVFSGKSGFPLPCAD